MDNVFTLVFNENKHQIFFYKNYNLQAKKKNVLEVWIIETQFKVHIIAKYQYMYVNYKPHTKNQKKWSAHVKE